METTLPASGVPGEEHAVLPHEAEDPLVIGGRFAGFDPLPIGQCGDAAIAVGGPFVD
jgi:hypothetical protein